MAIQIQIRRDTAANWTSSNPTLAQGEIGYVTDTKKMKIGDGSTAWATLPYYPPAFVGCRVRSTGATAITSSWNTITFNTETFDTDGMHDNSSNSERITITTAGKYLVGGTVSINANALCGARILVHNSGGETTIAIQKQGNSGAIESASVSAIYDMAAGDYFYLQGYAGTNQNTYTDGTFFWAYKID